MIQAYRLFEDIPTHSSLGYGSRGGRWNHQGSPLIYSTNIISLNFLELYCIKGPIVAKSKWRLVCIEIKGPLPILDIKNLPKDWNIRPHSRSTKDFGTIWANSKDSICLKVPSARIPLSAYPSEYNLLINPLHPDFFNSIKITSEKEVEFQVNSRFER